MKRNVCRIGSAAVCAALCLTLGCSCSVLPPASGKPAAPASSVPTDAHGDPLYDSSRLDDGKLRMLYGYDNSGGACTVLCGSKVLYQSARSENVSLLQDIVTGETNYWFRSWSDSTGRGGRRSALYDKDGNEVLEPIYISAPEFQVLDNANHPDAKLGKDNNRQAASLYDMIPAVPQNAKPFGEWNKAKIMVYKGTVVHGQNDENVLEYHLWTKQWTEMLQASKFSEEKWPLAFELLNNCGGENHEGFIGVQDHGDDVWYRNIRVKVLD